MVAILGLNAFHSDASAALLIDGQLIAAMEEERYTRVKHDSSFPRKAISGCLEMAGLSIDDIDHIAINSDSKARRLKKLLFVAKNNPSPSLIMTKAKNKWQRKNSANFLRKYFSTSESYEKKVVYVEHHRAHCASAFFGSGFDEAVVLSIDGFGDFCSTAGGIGSGKELDIYDIATFPHSLGIFYSAITQFLGFRNYGDEYKVMGLAPYGETRFTEELRSVIKEKANGSFRLNLDYFRHHSEDLKHQWSEGYPFIDRLYSDKLVDLLGKPRNTNEEVTQFHKDIAASLQNVYETIFFNILESLNKKYSSNKLCLAGGCAANSVANGKIKERTRFEEIYIAASPGDAGGAIGAALDVWNSQYNEKNTPISHSYLGTNYSEEDITSFLASSKTKESVNYQGEKIKIERIQEVSFLIQTVVSALLQGEVVGWFQGGMEWGPRALGNRSILGDPRRRDMKDIINSKIKFRESFRPFAPSILRDEVKNWFEVDGDVPFMMEVYKFKEHKRDLVPAVCHVDGSGRLQTVTEQSNKIYYELIKAFHEKTGVPMLLNTSFNENEPIVRTPEEALSCFLRTEMDILVIENGIVRRESSEKK